MMTKHLGFVVRKAHEELTNISKRKPRRYSRRGLVLTVIYKFIYVCLLLKLFPDGNYFFLQAQMSLPCALKSWNSAAAVNSASVEEFRPVSQES